MDALVSNRGLLSRTFSAITNKSMGGPGGFVQHNVPIPTISSNEILVKVTAVALNPTDFKHLDLISPPRSIIGCDYAGVVEKVGEAVEMKWKPGDRVAGAVHGGIYPDRGAFATYLKVEADLAWKIPDTMADTDATTYGISAITAMLDMNVHHELPFITDEKSQVRLDETIFIYAGSTSAGLFHIQIAKAAGCSVVTTASPRSFDLVKRFGADHVYDYTSPNVAKDILKNHTNISKAVDCFSEKGSTAVCAEVVRAKGGKVMMVLPNSKPNVPNVTYDLVMAYTVFGRAFHWLPPIGPKFEARPQDREALIRLYEVLPRITHILKPIPTTQLKDGFEGILEGLDKLRAGQVSGGKQVVVFNT